MSDAPIVNGQTVRQLQAVNDGEGMLVLLRINHASWAAPICIVNDSRDVEHGGETYVNLPFAVTLPNDKAKEAPRAKLEVDNVGRDITGAFESLPAAAVLMAKLTLVSRNTPEIERWSFTAPLSGISATPKSITGDMGWDLMMRRGLVRIRFDQFTAPGLFEEV